MGGGGRLRHPPEAFLAVCNALYVGADQLEPSLEAWADQAIFAAAPEARSGLLHYINDVLDGRYTNAELRGLLQRTGMAYGFTTKGARMFLECLRDALERAGTR
jgi:hypothetical protein